MRPIVPLMLKCMKPKEHVCFYKDFKRNACENKSEFGWVCGYTNENSGVDASGDF